MEKTFGLWALDRTRGTILTVTAFPKPKARLVFAIPTRLSVGQFADLARRHNLLLAEDRAAFRRAYFGKE